ncbi:ABC transporter substrate-binding protein [Dethiosulfovibrio salsuginis]|uniref:Peptide/nickel transport system substrate-binding protein n=1 Tax=Dethiosulfovibrio salsuginis TaxID=561720 RepID=A0A1X7IL73_9BACT|nr:ABC transporter substrate-binding protein [Dethiosulfovibrio salsuginis]SMG15275.1 peptide/nickel transport system substrate-binding protein [Dethiosulfovibrio salsuginis]
MKGTRRTKGLTWVVLSAVFLGLMAIPALAKDTLTIANIYDARSLDPIVQNEVAASGAICHINETLIDLDDEGNPIPLLAEEFEQIDPTTYRFVLRKGVKFHNGDPFTAADVLYSIERAKSPLGSAIKQYPEIIESVVAEDDYTVVIKIKYPFTPFWGTMAHTSLAVVNQRAVEEKGDMYPMNPVGTGPFTMKEWVKNDKLVLERFEEYWGDKPAYKTLVMRSVPESVNRTIELETGAVDIAYLIPTADVSRVKDNKDLNVISAYQHSTCFMGFNTAKEPWNDPRVREAVKLALDINGARHAVFRGTGETPVSLVPKTIKYSDQSATMPKRDVERAKQLLAEAGVKLPLKAQIWSNAYKPRVDLAQIFQAQLKEVGIEIEAKVLEWGAYLDGLKLGDHDMYILGWTISSVDPDGIMSGIVHSGGGSNYAKFHDEEIDALIDKGKTMPDGPEREALYMDLQKRLNEQNPYLYLYAEETFYGVKNEVENFIPSARGYHNLAGVSFK